MATITEQALKDIRDRKTLSGFLVRELGWPVSDQSDFLYEGPQIGGTAATQVAVSQIIPLGTNEPFTIFLAEFATGFRRTDLREILRAIRRAIREQAAYEGRDLEELVFVCATKGYTGLRFAHFEERAGGQPRLRVFGFDQETINETYTLRHINLPALAMPDEDMHGERDWGEGKKRWMEAWNVEKVTKDFYSTYERVFHAVEAKIENVAQSDRRLFTQRLFNRLLFVQFLSKKGWLRFNGRTDYLFALRDAARAGNENFYADRLYWLFFHGLGTLLDSREAHARAELQAKRGEVPFLNGGLFEMETKGGSDERGVVQIPNDAFDLILDDIFACYNFTISESTPDDVEVAVDPEMLGKVFEELVTESERHGSGSYYTPRPIVAFMCREALKGYLADVLPGGANASNALAAFVDESDPSGLRDPETVLSALKTVTVCDPACGSGAYLLGMMQELLRLREALFATQARDYARIYDRKLEIIQRNLYGGDKEPFAVNIAMLRLWLSLVVDDDRNPLDDPQTFQQVSLPNLKFKIQQGDTLSAPAPPNQTLQRDEYAKDAAKLRALYDEYFRPGRAGASQRAKSVIENDIAKVQSDAAKLFDQAPAGSLDWRIAFAEVFVPPVPQSTWTGRMALDNEAAAQQSFTEDDKRAAGFDIVLANPPYVRQELIKDQKPGLKAIYPEVYTGTADLYCYFYARALQLLRPGGMLAFISSNKWFRAGYGANLRKHIAETCRVCSITDFGDLPVFESATAYPMIFIAQKGNPGGATLLTEPKSLQPPYPNITALTQALGQTLPRSAIAGSAWQVVSAASKELRGRMESNSTPLNQYSQIQIYSGIKSGYNAAFLIDDEIRSRLILSDPKSLELIKPFGRGDDTRRWSIRDVKQFLIYTPSGIDIEQYPVIKQHLGKHRQRLQARAVQQPWWQLQQAQNRPGVWTSKKLFFQILHESLVLP